jgi:hypothetical protein
MLSHGRIADWQIRNSVVAECSCVTDLKPCAAHTCRMLCPHGFAVGHDGCPRCQCYDPCSDIKCPGLLSCELENVECIKPPCLPVPKCEHILSLFHKAQKAHSVTALCTLKFPPNTQPLIWTCQSVEPHNVDMIMVHRQEGSQPSERVSCRRAPQDHRQSTPLPLWDLSRETQMSTTIWMSRGDRWVSWQSAHPIRDHRHCYEVGRSSDRPLQPQESSSGYR